MSRNGFPVLLVEDNEDDVLFVRRAFRQAKLAPALHVAENGDAALEYLSGEGGFADRQCYPLPNLILLDIKLPRLSGLEVLEWIRGHPELRRTPVVMLTSSAERSDVNRAYDLGANGYLVKPVEYEGLSEIIKTLGMYWLVMSEIPDPASG
jgi:CheY-like chemotaxis protein